MVVGEWRVGGGRGPGEAQKLLGVRVRGVMLWQRLGAGVCLEVGLGRGLVGEVESGAGDRAEIVVR